MEPYKTNLQWINIRDPSGVKDEETQTVVKSHVMREFRREERWNLSRGSSALPSQNPSTMDLMSQLDQSQTSPGEYLRATYPYSYFSSSFSTEVQEHFGCLSRPLGQSAPSHEDIARSLAAQHRAKISSSPPPMQIDDVRFIRTQEWPDTSALLQYFARFLLLADQTSSSKSAVEAYFNTWMEAIRRQPSIFLGAIFAASSHNDTVKEQSATSQTLYLKSRTLGELASNLAHPEGCQSQFIPAILLLLNFELLSDDFEAHKTHLLGLLRLFNSVGGLESTCVDRHFHNATLISDVLGSFMYVTKRAFPQPEQRPNPEPIPIREWVSGSFEVGELIMNLLVALMGWTRTFLASTRKSPRRDSSPSVASAGIIVQEAFDRIPTTLTGSTHIQRACVAAAHIYWTSIKLSMPLNAPLNYQKVYQIKRALTAAAPDAWNGGSEILLWVLLVAVAATRHRSEKCWFVAYLVPLGLRLGTLEYHRTMDMISGFMAVEDYLNTRASSAGSTAGDVEAFEG